MPLNITVEQPISNEPWSFIFFPSCNKEWSSALIDMNILGVFQLHKEAEFNLPYFMKITLKVCEKKNAFCRSHYFVVSPE